MAIASTNKGKIIDEKCLSCFKKTYQKLFIKFKVSDTEKLAFFVFYHETILNSGYLSPPEIQQKLNKRFCEIIGIHDPFFYEKEENNKIALALYLQWKPLVKNSVDSFNLALRLAIAGNIMDYGANHEFDIFETIQNVVNSNFAIDNTLLFKESISAANTILYLGDNAGEIVFDKLFIETCLQNKTVYFAVRGNPILNDVTLKDAEDVGMNEVARIISNGNGVPSTLINKCNYDFKKIYKSADLIISKGQGNLEGLINENDLRIFFLLMVKCEVIAELLGIKKENFVVYNQIKK